MSPFMIRATSFRGVVGASRVCPGTACAAVATLPLIIVNPKITSDPASRPAVARLRRRIDRPLYDGDNATRRRCLYNVACAAEVRVQKVPGI
jgi:hypothetical protein